MEEEKDDDEAEIFDNIFKKLNYFFNSGQAIHFKLKNGEWRNAIIRSVDKENSLMTIKEFKIGNLVVFFSDINPDSITAYTTRGLEDDFKMGLKDGEDK
jgi:hypothetical protein